MKKPNIILLFLMVLAWTGCHKDKEINVKEAVVSNEEITVAETQARFSWQVDFVGQFQTGVEVSPNENMSDLRRVEATKVEDRFQSVVDNLLEGTKYYYRIVVWNKFSSSEQPVGHFTTLETPLDTTFYTVTVSCLPEEGGLVSGGGTFAEGDTCTVVATANAGYNFVNWTENENQISTDSVYTFAVTGDHVLVANFSVQAPNTYNISVSANPSNGGTVSGGGTFSQGESCTVIATAAEGYTFDNWNEDGEVVSEDANYTFTVTGDRTLVANFSVQAPNTFNINVSPNPSNGGTVTGGGSYDQGASCTVTATANNGYTFSNWTENGNVVSEEANYTFTVTANRTLLANFVQQQYTINTSVYPTNSGTITGNQSPYTYGQYCNLTATPNDGYTFTNWTENGNVVSTNASYTFTVNDNRTLVANFAMENYTISVSAIPTNGGTVYVGDIPGTIQGTYTNGQSCKVHAIPKAGYTFTNWTENGNVVSDMAEYQFVVTYSRNLVANFTKTHTINVSANPTNGGTVTGGGTFPHGESCTVIATAAEGYTFDNWTEDGEVVSEDANYTFTVTEDRTLEAHFSVQAPDTYVINVSPNPTNGGTITGNQSPYTYGQTCNLTAHANNGYTFTNWTENGNVVSTNANYTFTVTGNRTLVANFTQQQYTITATANPTNGGTITGNQSPYTYGQTCNLTAHANNGYTFTNWTENGNVVSTNANYTFTVTGNRTLVAQFQAQQYTITATANPTNGGTISGNQSPYTYGQTCSLTATPANGYTFIRWTENGNQVSTNPNYSFTVTGNRTLVAQFQAQQYTITATANPTNGGTATVSGNGTFTYNQQCTLTATPNSHYSFTNWKKGNNVVSTDAIYTFYVTESASYTANFTQDPQYTITATANPTNGGTVTGGGTYYAGTTVNLTANANSGFTFDHWQDGNTNNPRTITVTGNATYTAYFEAQPQAPQGAINGKFTINGSGGKVYFSKGNLQYQASTNTWQFAEHQYDYVGNANNAISQTNSGWIDLFGWGTSGYNHGAVCYQPWSTSQTNSDYYAYGNWQYNLYDQTGQADWGYNAISNGGNTTNTWRTLTGGSGGEWDYVFNTRSTTSGIRYAKAQVNGVNGVILLPDDWSASYYSLSNTNQGGASYTGNVISASQWNTLEEHGAVFLPAAGRRNGTSVSNVGSYGSYWSASYNIYNSVYGVCFSDINLITSGNSYDRYYGFTVRLVSPCQ